MHTAARYVRSSLIESAGIDHSRFQFHKSERVAPPRRNDGKGIEGGVVYKIANIA